MNKKSTRSIRMKNKRYFIILVFLVLSGAIFYLPMNSLNLTSETARNGINDKDVEESIKENGQKTSSTPQLSQTLAWDDNGTVICNEDTQGQISQQICYDGNGGAIITWADYRNGATNADIYAQKIDSARNTQWKVNGTVICNATTSQYSPQIASDGNGGAIITWYDGRSGNNDIYAQRIDSAGNTQWGDGTMWGGFQDRNGTVICNATAEQRDPKICSDDADGAIIVWQDKRSGGGTPSDIYAQRINKTGDTQWGETFWSGPGDRNGTVICNATNNQINLQICSVRDDGAIITWEDGRSGNNDIYAQKINKTGNTQWGDGTMWGGFQDRNGTVICNATDDQSNPEICSDGDDGAIITWHDFRNAADYNIYAQKINSAGNTQWGDDTMWGGFQDRNGTVICNEDIFEQFYPQICSDDADGAIITWEDERCGGGKYNVYAQKIDSDGNTQWGDGSTWGVIPDRNGTVICNVPNTLINSQICSDGNGGAIITWEDDRIVSTDIYAQKINSAGNTQWGNGSTWGALPDRNGTLICNAILNQKFPKICSDGVGGAIITWEDERGGTKDIYAQRIRRVSGRAGLGLSAGDDDDDDDTGIVVVVVFIIIIACVGGVVVVVIVLIKKGIIDTSKLKRG